MPDVDIRAQAVQDRRPTSAHSALFADYATAGADAWATLPYAELGALPAIRPQRMAQGLAYARMGTTGFMVSPPTTAENSFGLQIPGLMDETYANAIILHIRTAEDSLLDALLVFVAGLSTAQKADYTLTFKVTDTADVDQYILIAYQDLAFLSSTPVVQSGYRRWSLQLNSGYTLDYAGTVDTIPATADIIAELFYVNVVPSQAASNAVLSVPVNLYASSATQADPTGVTFNGTAMSNVSSGWLTSIQTSSVRIATGQAVRSSDGTWSIADSSWSAYSLADSFAVQYSVDGSTGWHATYAETDKWIRMRTTDGLWTAPVPLTAEHPSLTLLERDNIYIDTGTSYAAVLASAVSLDSVRMLAFEFAFLNSSGNVLTSVGYVMAAKSVIALQGYADTLDTTDATTQLFCLFDTERSGILAHSTRTAVTDDYASGRRNACTIALARADGDTDTSSRLLGKVTWGNFAGTGRTRMRCILI